VSDKLPFPYSILGDPRKGVMVPCNPSLPSAKEVVRMTDPHDEKADQIVGRFMDRGLVEHYEHKTLEMAGVISRALRATAEAARRDGIEAVATTVDVEALHATEEGLDLAAEVFTRHAELARALLDNHPPADRSDLEEAQHTIQAQSDQIDTLLFRLDAEEGQATGWECRDYADGWIKFDTAAAAKTYQAETGALMRVTYMALPAGFAPTPWPTDLAALKEAVVEAARRTAPMNGDTIRLRTAVKRLDDALAIQQKENEK
jgi:hypothetical protein